MMTRKPGFTLFEILIVVTIIGILFAMIGPKIAQKMTQSKEKTTLLKIGMLKEALMSYNLFLGRYPNTKEGLKALIENPYPNNDQYKQQVSKWPFASETDIQDDTGTDFTYHCPPEKNKKYKSFEIIWVGTGTDDEPQYVDGV